MFRDPAHEILYDAIVRDDVPACRRFVAEHEDYDLNYFDGVLFGSLNLAIVFAKINAYTFLVDEAGVKIGRLDELNERERYYEQPLVAAVRTRNLYVVKDLIKRGACVNSPIGKAEHSPLHAAIFCGSLGVFRALLVARGTNVHVRYPNGDTYLHVACRETHRVVDPEVIKLLLTKGLDPNLRNNAGETPWRLANAVFKRAIEEWIDVQKTLFRLKLPLDMRRNVTQYL